MTGPLEHLNAAAQTPKRVVVLGAGGFVGGALRRRLRKVSVPVLALARGEIDLARAGAAAALTGLLAPGDSLVMAAAAAPCKTNAMLIDNIAMMAAVCEAIERVAVGHVVYISSDAVYADEPRPLSEASPAEPSSLHGAMHLAREVMLREACRAPLAVLRPTLIYGDGDPHNGYGPNRFLRLAAGGKDIVLFGDGEERRDHVLIDDVAEVARLALLRRSRGVLNIATGTVWSFREVAEKVAARFDPPPAIKGGPRRGPMPHGGYRPFDIALCKRAFPEFAYTPLDEGLARIRSLTMERANG